jgi:histone-lysine N-methyltransferase SETD2
MKLEPSDNATDVPIPNGGGGVNEADSHAESPMPSTKDERATPSLIKSRSASRTPIKTESSEIDEGILKGEDNDGSSTEKVGGGISVKLEPGQPPKLARSSSQKVVPRPPQLFSHLPDSTRDSQKTFEVIQSCQYANKYMGYTEHAMECDCTEEWGESAFFLSYLFRVLRFIVALPPQSFFPFNNQSGKLPRSSEVASRIAQIQFYVLS